MLVGRLHVPHRVWVSLIQVPAAKGRLDLLTPPLHQCEAYGTGSMCKSLHRTGVPT